MKPKKQNEEKGHNVDQLKRKFLKGCGLTVLTTASYHIISILSVNANAHADMCHAGCIDACVTSCTGCTTVNCTGSTAPDPSPPECVEGFTSE